MNRLGAVLRPTVGRLLLWVFRTRFIGADNVPSDSGAVLAGNHASYLDPILLWCGAPRPTRFMAKRELWDRRFLAWILPRVWAFPVDRDRPDRTAILTATDTLEAGGLVGVFPEGTRIDVADTGHGEGHGGAAFIALRAGAPVIPVALVGTGEAWPRGKRLPRPTPVTIRFGEPIDPSSFEGSRKERVAAMTAEIMRRIGEELEAAREVHRAR